MTVYLSRGMLELFHFYSITRPGFVQDSAYTLRENCREATSSCPEGNCRDAWNRLVAKYSPKTTSSLLKMKKKFENSKLEDGKDPEEWISYLEGIRAEIEAIDSTAAISEKDFMVHVINNLPEAYDVIYDGLESKLSQTGDEALTIEKMRDKINERFDRVEGLRDEDMMNDSEGLDEETGLAAITAQLSRMSKKELACFVKQFKGNC